MEKHFELCPEYSILWHGITLYRIRLTKDHPLEFGKKGDLGGYIEKEENLDGYAWVGEEAKVWGDAIIYGSSLVSGSAEIYDNAIVSDEAEVYGDCMVYGKAKIYGNARISGNVGIRGCARIRSQTKIDGDILIEDAIIGGKAQISGENIKITGGAQIDGEAIIMGRNIRIYEQAHITGNAIIDGTGDRELKIFGDTFLRAYKWTQSPLQIQGTRHFFSICPVEDGDREGTPTMGIKIGCTEMTFESWERDYKSEGENADYTPEQIEEYWSYIKLAIHLYATYGY